MAYATVQPVLGSALLRSNPDTLGKLLTLRESLEEKAVLKEKRRLAQVNSKRVRMLAYEHRPVEFVQEVAGEFMWSKQQDVMNSVRDHRRTAVPSCHDVGKSFIAARVVAWWLVTSKPGEAFVVTTAPSFAQVRNILWREISRIHAKLPVDVRGRLNQTEWFMEVDSGVEELIAFGRKPADYDPTAFQGIHQRKVLVVMDEGCGVPLMLYTAAETLVTNELSRILVIGNPDDPATQFSKVCQPGSGWNVVHISALDSPNFTGEEVPPELRELLISPLWVEEKQREWGKTSPLYISKVLGQFPEESADGLVPLGKINEAKMRGAELGEEPDLDVLAARSTKRELGFDVARFGNDYTCGKLNFNMNVVPWLRYNGQDTMRSAGEIVACVERFKLQRVKIDDIGVGGGVTDRVREIQREQREAWDQRKLEQKNPNLAAPALVACEIVPVNVGVAPIRQDEKLNFMNLRAQINWEARLMFLNDEITISPADEHLLSQAGQIKYERTSKGQLKIMSKDDMKVEMGISPDDWDAFILAVADVHAVGAGLLEFYREQLQQAKGGH